VTVRAGLGTSWTSGIVGWSVAMGVSLVLSAIVGTTPPSSAVALQSHGRRRRAGLIGVLLTGRGIYGGSN